MKSITLSLFITVANIYNILSSGIIEVDFYKKKSVNPFSKSLNFLISDMKVFQESFPLINSPMDEMILHLCLGTPPQCFDVLVDSGSYHLWIRDLNNTSSVGNKFDHKNSSTFVNLNIPMKIEYGTGHAEGEASSDVLTLGDKKLDKLNFILVHQDESNDGIDGILGLGNYYNNLEEKNALEFSLIDQLYNNNQINSKIFTQKYTENGKGKMFIGDLPDEIKNDMGHYGKCPTIKYTYYGELNPRWDCELKSFYFGDHTSYNKYQEHISPVLFDTGTNIVLVPGKFFLQLQLTYFKNLIESGQCDVTEDDSGFFAFLCSPNVRIRELPDINFSFGEWVITMKPADLFVRMPFGFLQFMMIGNPNLNMWIFGEPILKKYHIVFDKTNDVIGFYGAKDLYWLNDVLPNNDIDNIEKDMMISQLKAHIFELEQQVNDYDNLNKKFRNLQNESSLLNQEKLRLEYELKQITDSEQKQILDLRAELENIQLNFNNKLTINKELYTKMKIYRNH